MHTTQTHTHPHTHTHTHKRALGCTKELAHWHIHTLMRGEILHCSCVKCRVKVYVCKWAYVGKTMHRSFAVQ